MSGRRKGTTASSSISDGYASAFGKALDEQLARRRMLPSMLARALQVSPSYVSKLRNGKNVSSSTVNSIASSLNLNPYESQALLYAAGADKGYTPNVTAIYTAEDVCPHCGKTLGERK